MKDVHESLCGYKLYPYLNPSIAKMSNDSPAFDEKEFDSREFKLTQTDGAIDDGRSGCSGYAHEFLVCAILEFQKDMQAPETITEPFRLLPEGSDLKPPITFLRKGSKRTSL